MSQMDDSQVDPQLLSGKVIESDLQNSNWNASGKKRPRPEESPSRSEHRQKLGPPEKSSSILSKRALRSHDQYRRPAVQNDPGELSRPTQEALEHVRNGQSLARKEGAIYDFEDDDQPKSNKTTSATMTKKTGRKAKQASGKRGRPKENKSYVSSTRQRSEKSRAATKTSKSTPQEPSSPGEGSYQESVQVVSSEEEEEAEDAEMQKSGRTNLTRGHPDSGSDANPALFGEHEQWTRILNSAKENTSEAEFMEFVTTGKGLTGLSKTLIANTRKAIEFYKTSRDDGNSTHPHLQEGEDIHKPMRLIEWAVEKFPMLDVDIDASEHDQGKSRKAITSLHQWIIPGLVYLLGACLSSRYDIASKSYDYHGFNEVIDIIHYIDQLCDAAKSWILKPTSTKPIVRPIKSGVYSPIRRLKKIFDLAFESMRIERRKKRNYERYALPSQLRGSLDEGGSQSA